jgi:hypothetical protein
LEQIGKVTYSCLDAAIRPDLDLAGFRSRWMIPRSWAASSAAAIFVPIRSASSTGTGPCQSVSARQTLNRDAYHGEYVTHILLNAYAAAVGRPALVTSSVLEVSGAPARSFHDWTVDHAGDFATLS